MKVIDGKAIARQIEAELTKEIEETCLGKRKPSLITILVGDDGASETYVKNKISACKRVGIDGSIIHLPDSCTQEELINEIKYLNSNPFVDGILVQLPLPTRFDTRLVTRSIDPFKDVDGFHPTNIGKLVLGDETGFVPATPAGILELLKREEIQTKGKNVAVIGRSDIVGRPVSILLSQKGIDSTVTLIHSQTPLATRSHILSQADIIIAAVGEPNFISAGDYNGTRIGREVVLVDVGITRVSDPSLERGYRLVGDIHPNRIGATHFTPVPGGVGPMTIAMLLRNAFKAYRQSSEIDLIPFY